MTALSGLSLNVRPACPDDEETLFLWRNDPWIVHQGLSQRTVTRDEHHRWFLSSLEKKEREVFLVEIDGNPMGMLRYDFESPDDAEVSIYLLPPFPGHGYGQQVIVTTLPEIFARRGIKRVIARVRHDNEQSLRFFRRLGFRDVEFRMQNEGYVLSLERPIIPHSRPWVGEAEASAAAAVVASRQLSLGPKVLELEQRWCEATGTVASAAVSSGVAALRLALLTLGIGPGDEVIVPAYSCVALLNAVLALGATPVLADIIPDYWTLSPQDARRHLTRRTKAIIAVHLFGFPAAIDELAALGLPVVEDCAHGIGGVQRGVPFGGAGTLSMASFYATKMLAAGEGGIVAGHDSTLIDRVRQARNYGDRPPDGRHLNDKMTDIQAALALVQLDRLSEIVTRRAERSQLYNQRLQPLANQGLLILPPETPGRLWYRYAVRLARHLAADLAAKMAEFGVRAEQPVWDLRGSTAWSETLTGTALAFDRVLSLPLYPDLTEFEQCLVSSALEVCLKRAS